MSPIPFNGADPSNILAALYRDLSPEEVVSLRIQCDARSSWEGEDNWPLVQQVLSHPSVYEAFGISSLSTHVRFNRTQGLEVIGTVANLLNRHGIHHDLSAGFEFALEEARRFLDVLFRRNYDGAVAYSSDRAWCSWFVDEGILDETVLVKNGGEWWLLAISSTD